MVLLRPFPTDILRSHLSFPRQCNAFDNFLLPVFFPSLLIFFNRWEVSWLLMQNFTLSGPTLFGHVVNKAAEIAAESLKYNQRKYFVLLIITVINGSRQDYF